MGYLTDENGLGYGGEVRYIGVFETALKGRKTRERNAQDTRSLKFCIGKTANTYKDGQPACAHMHTQPTALSIPQSKRKIAIGN